MIAWKLALVAIALSAASAAAATPAVEIPADNVATLLFVAGLIAFVAAAVAWVDRRIAGALRAHMEAERELDDARAAAVLAEVRAIRELVRGDER